MTYNPPSLVILLCLLLADYTVASNFGEDPIKSGISTFLNQRVSSFLWEKRNWTWPISDDCRKSFSQVDELLAIRYLDASGHVPSGLLDGTITSLGDYDGCLAIHASAPTEDDEGLNGKYCLIQFEARSHSALDSPALRRLKESVSIFKTYFLSIAVCLPQSCSPKDIRQLFDSHFESSVIQISSAPIHCDTNASNVPSLWKLDVFQLLSISFIVTIIFVIWIATIIHLMRPSLLREVPGLHNCSLLHNWKMMLRPRPSSRKEYGNVDDVRFLFALYVTGVHSLACATEFRAFRKILRLQTDFYDKFTWLSLQPGFNVVGIEMFFCIAGFTTVFSCRHLLKGRISFHKVLSTIILRWLRIVPCLVVLMASEFVWPLFGNGPMHSELSNIIYRNCKKNWWKNIFLVSNYDDVSDMCLTHVWYSSAEFQLFVLGVLVLAILRVHENLGIFISALFLMLGMVIPGIKSWLYGVSPAALIRDNVFDKANEFFNEMYFPTYCHFSSFFIGLLTAYFIETKRISMDSMREHRIKGFILMCGFVFISYFPAIWNTFDYPMDPKIAGIYSLTHRIIWTLGGISGIVFLGDLYIILLKPLLVSVQKTHNNNETKTSIGYMQEQARILEVGGQLYFSLYLVHSLFIRFNWFTSRTMFKFDVQANGLRGMYSVGSCLGLAFLFHIYFERTFENFRHALKDKINKQEKLE